MNRRGGRLVASGWLVTGVALAAVELRVAHGNVYPALLYTAFAGAMAGMLLFAAALRRGSGLVRTLAGLGAIPVCYVLVDFTRRLNWL